MSFHREKYRPKGGPDGGNGGRGGSVVFAADASVGSLSWLRDHPHQRAAPGGPGRSNNRTGAGGEDLVLGVPPGTVIRDDAGTVLADLAAPGDRFVAARGGRGGRGNAAFLSDARRAPGFAELGEPPEERWVLCELRVIADVAVIGYPNAGKSTLVSVLTAARPKVADYAFTTLEPTPGVVEHEGERFTICDLPGLIEGAHEGRGLGLKFLRHAQRALVFLHLLDAASGRDPIEDHGMIRGEVTAFDESLGARAEIVALNKVDAVEPGVVEDFLARLRAAGIEALPISARERIGLEPLLAALREAVTTARAARPAGEGFELLRTEAGGIAVETEDDAWRVRGASVERWVAMTDLENPEGVAYLQARMERAGHERALAAAGASPGDEVRIGKAVFEWWPAGVMPGEASGGRARGEG